MPDLQISASHRAWLLAIVLAVLAGRPTPLAAVTRSVRVGVFPAAPLVLNTPDQPTGFFIELLETIALKEGWTLEYVQGTWQEHLAALRTGTIDLLPAVGHTPERLAFYEFNSDPVFIDSGVVFRQPSFPVHTVFDLAGKTIAAVRGSIFTAGFEAYIASFGIQCAMVYTEDNPAVMRLIESGAAEAGITIYSLGSQLERDYAVEMTAISFSPLALHYAIGQVRNRDLLVAINAALTEMLPDNGSVYARLYEKWILPQPSQEIPAWLYAALAVAGLLVASFIGLSLLLRRQVELQTKHLTTEIAAHKETNQKIALALEERGLLMRELYHRTKNNLQLIHSLFLLQANEYPDNATVNDMVAKIDSRIQAISLAQQLLFEFQNLSQISIKSYIANLSGSILEGFGSDGTVQRNLEVADLLLPIERIGTIGLILNELMTNSLKHAFPDRRGGSFTIRFTATAPDSYRLEYLDDGIGFQPGNCTPPSKTLGLLLVDNLIDQLGGTVRCDSTGGVQFRLGGLTTRPMRIALAEKVAGRQIPGS